MRETGVHETLSVEQCSEERTHFWKQHSFFFFGVHKMKKRIDAVIGIGRKSRSCYNFCCPTAQVCWIQGIQWGFTFLRGREAADSNITMDLVAGQWVTDILQLFAIFLFLPLLWKQVVTFRGTEVKTLACLFEGEDTRKPIKSGCMVIWVCGLPHWTVNHTTLIFVPLALSMRQ